MDVYPVENFHSRLRHHILGIPSTTSEKFRQNAIFIDKNWNNTFGTNFANTHNYPYTKKKIDFLAKQTAIFLLNFFSEIWRNSGYVEIKYNTKKKNMCFIKSFTKGFVFDILPLGYHSKSWPHNDKFCNCWNCNNILANDGFVLNCGHAYHIQCFAIAEYKCHYCFEYLSEAIEELSQSYNERLNLNIEANDNIEDETDFTQSNDIELNEAEEIQNNIIVDTLLQ